MMFILGLIIFFAPHLMTTFAPDARNAAIRRLGPKPYKGVYSLVSLVGFVLIVLGWPSADATVLYAPPEQMRYATQAFMLLSLILLASAYLPKGRIAHAVKHPMLAAVKLWAFGHLLSNGEARSVLLFGAFLAYAVLDRIAVKKRNAAIPVKGPPVNDAFLILAGVLLWAAIYFYLHRFIGGVPLR